MALSVAASLERVGTFSSMCADTGVALVTRGLHRREFLDQAAFLANVSLLPVVFITIPFTVVIQFFIGQLLQEIGAIDLAGAGAGLAVVQELGPFTSVLVIAGAGATAVCADLGSRTIREEVDAMRTLGIDPIHRLVAPRVVAFGVVSVGLFAIVATVGLVGSYAFSTFAQGGSPGLFVHNLTLLTSLTDFAVSIIKTAVFGVAAGLVACFLGLHVKGGPKGVGEAVNQTVIFSLMLLLALNTLITSIYFQLAR